MAITTKPTTPDVAKQFPEDPRAKRRSSDRRRLSAGTFREYGYVFPDGDPIPPEYLVKITSYRNNCTIIAPVQEDIKLAVESYWEPTIPTSILRAANTAIQLDQGGKRSAITSATTRRLWQGTSPMTITVPLKFECTKDPYIEVLEPCRLLQTIALPSDPVSDRKPVSPADLGKAFATFSFGEVAEELKKIVSQFPLLRPPGPSPFVAEGLLNGQTNYTQTSQSMVRKQSRHGDFIMVEFGTFLTFWNVIVKSGGVSFKTKFGSDGYPVSADAEIVFETYEMPTKESLEYSYTKITG